MNKWTNSLLNNRTTKNILRMFGKKRNNKGMIWASALGLGVSAVAALGLGRNRRTNIQNPVKDIMRNFQTGRTGKIQNFDSIATEFAKELLPPKENK